MANIHKLTFRVLQGRDTGSLWMCSILAIPEEGEKSGFSLCSIYLSIFSRLMLNSLLGSSNYFISWNCWLINWLCMIFSHTSWKSAGSWWLVQTVRLLVSSNKIFYSLPWRQNTNNQKQSCSSVMSVWGVRCGISSITAVRCRLSCAEVCFAAEIDPLPKVSSRVEWKKHFRRSSFENRRHQQPLKNHTLFTISRPMFRNRI